MPLLILWLGYGEREATGTSLAAIPVIAAVGARCRECTGTWTWARADRGRARGRGGARRDRASAAGLAAGRAGIFAVLLVASAAVLVF